MPTFIEQVAFDDRGSKAQLTWWISALHLLLMWDWPNITSRDAVIRSNVAGLASSGGMGNTYSLLVS